MRTLLPLNLSLSAALVAGIAPAQLPSSWRGQDAKHSMVEAVAQARGVLRTEDEILAMGPGYRAWFGADGVDFGVPGGPVAMRWALERIGRRTACAAEWTSPQAAEPRIGSGRTVIYERGTVTERYDARRDGVEQSFVFAALPRGEGDLVVQLRLQTALTPSARGMAVDRMAFRDSAQVGVGIGAITGIDAGGARSTGLMRLEGDCLELVLPAAFVESASLPLVLDPLIGLSFPVGAPVPRLADLAVSYDVTNDVFLVVWSEAVRGAHGGFSSTDSFGILVSSGGTASDPFCVECTPLSPAFLTSLVNVNATDTFVALLSQTFQHQIVAVDAATGGRRTAFWDPAPGGGTATARGGGLGGEWTTVEDDVVLVTDVGSGSIAGLEGVWAAEIDVPVTGPISETKRIQLSLHPSPRDPHVAISSSAGASGRHLATWMETPTAVHGAILDRGLSVLDQGLVMELPSNATNGEVAGDGDKWLVVYSCDDGLIAIPVFWDPRTQLGWTGSARVLLAGTATLRDVEWTGHDYLVSYTVSGSNFLLSVDPFTCAPCEGTFPLTFGRAKVASQTSGGSQASDLSLVVGATLNAQLFQSASGVTVDLGGGCGEGGFAAATCAIVGNQSFVANLRNATPGVAAFLVLGVAPTAFSCGPCQLIPAPLAALPAGLTGVRGNAALSLPIPNAPGLLGATLLQQWVTVAGTACPLGIQLSNALQVQLQ